MATWSPHAPGGATSDEAVYPEPYFAVFAIDQRLQCTAYNHSYLPIVVYPLMGHDVSYVTIIGDPVVHRQVQLRAYFHKGRHKRQQSSLVALQYVWMSKGSADNNAQATGSGQLYWG